MNVVLKAIHVAISRWRKLVEGMADQFWEDDMICKRGPPGLLTFICINLMVELSVSDCGGKGMISIFYSRFARNVVNFL